MFVVWWVPWFDDLLLKQISNGRVFSLWAVIVTQSNCFYCFLFSSINRLCTTCCLYAITRGSEWRHTQTSWRLLTRPVRSMLVPTGMKGRCVLDLWCAVCVCMCVYLCVLCGVFQLCALLFHLKPCFMFKGIITLSWLRISSSMSDYKQHLGICQQVLWYEECYFHVLRATL